MAVLTGCGGPLGAALATELVGRGARVCCIGRSVDELRATIDSLPAGSKAAMLQCDLASADDIVAAADFVERIGRPVDMLIHAAGLHADSTIAHGRVEGLDEHYLLNVRGPYLLTQRLLGRLLDARGQAVFFSAASEPDRLGGDVHHNIARAGTRALAAELRAEVTGRGVRVLSVQTDDRMQPGVDARSYLAVLARTVVDSLAEASVDVTEMHVRSVPHPVRTEQQ